MQWSKYQNDIFAAFEYTQDSLLINACAGSGKTTVLVELAKIAARAFPHLKIIFMAFNKSIAETLNARFAALGLKNVVAITLHAAGWSAWRRAGGLDWTPEVDQDKTYKIMKQVMPDWKEFQKWQETTRKLTAFAKGAGLVPNCLDQSAIHHRDCGMRYQGLIADTDGAWQELIDHYGLDEDECNIPIVRQVLARGIEIARESCDFDDMLYMPVIAGVPFERYDVVLVDEAQDVSGIQMEMISRMVTPQVATIISTEGRVIAVGDRNQAIYGFRGAGTDSMDQLQQRFGLRELPLSVSYRCPVAVVQHARQWVPQIEWREDAPDGIVFDESHDHQLQAEIALDGISKWRGVEDFAAGDAVLCRLNRPLVEAAFALIRRRVACRVLGRDIGKGLVDLVKKSKIAPGGDMSDFRDWLAGFYQKKAARLRAKRDFAGLGTLDDKLATLEVFMAELEDQSHRTGFPTVGELIRSIESLFSDDSGRGCVVLATVHKAKGQEWRRVFILDAGELMPCPWARGSVDGWQMQQERNLQYVAATRAAHELRYIKSEIFRGGD